MGQVDLTIEENSIEFIVCSRANIKVTGSHNPEVLIIWNVNDL